MGRISGSTAIGRRCALLIGTGAYDQPAELPGLRAPRNDVETLKRILTMREQCRFDDVIPLVDCEAQPVRKAVNLAFARAAADDLLLIYFTGHGKLSPEGQLHLCTRDTQPDLLPTTSFSLAELRGFIDTHRVSRVVIILDCCFSGAARETMKGDVPSLLTANLGQGRGKYLLTSSTAIEPSVERAEDECSLFTKWLVEGLETEHADLNGDHIITVEELFQYAKQRVEEEHASQHPQSFAFDTSPGDVILLRSKRVPPSTVSAPLEPLHPDWCQAVRAVLDEGKVIPFIGAGTYTGGVLNHFALSSALARRVGLSSQESLATTAEYYQQFNKKRSDLLDAFKEILTKQTRDITSPTTHDLILQLKAPWLVVSTTYDMVLENRIAQTGMPLVVVSHIMRSHNGVHDGKILVVRLGPRPSAEISLSDEVVLNEATDCVIYKILGSPFLHDYADPELDLDTLVLTETDHLTLLGSLRNEHTKVPTSFSVPLQKRKFLYLGYSLDIWHYRLVLQAFREAANKVSFAVRQPTSQMEKLFWERLGTELIAPDPEEFAKTLLTVEATTADAARA